MAMVSLLRNLISASRSVRRNWDFFATDGADLEAPRIPESGDLDPCITRIRLKRLRDFRGRLGRWSLSNLAMSTEMRYVGTC